VVGDDLATAAEHRSADLRSTEFGIVGSAAVTIPVGRSTLGLGDGYDFGLTNVFDEVDGGYKNRVLFLFASYGMDVGGGM
jgi:hypothetical protein